jgi:hypothetical protein
MRRLRQPHTAPNRTASASKTRALLQPSYGHQLRVTPSEMQRHRGCMGFLLPQRISITAMMQSSLRPHRFTLHLSTECLFRRTVPDSGPDLGLLRIFYFLLHTNWRWPNLCLWSFDPCRFRGASRGCLSNSILFWQQGFPLGGSARSSMKL